MITIDFVIHIGDIVSISLLLQFRLFTFRIVKLDSWTVTCTPCIMNLMMILTRRRGTYKGHFSSEKQFIIFYFEPGVASFRIMVLIPRVRGELKIYAKTYDFLCVLHHYNSRFNVPYSDATKRLWFRMRTLACLLPNTVSDTDVESVLTIAYLSCRKL